MDWDDIDWDEKVKNITKNQQKSQDSSETGQTNVQFLGSVDDGNYYEANQKKKQDQQEKSQEKAGSSRRPRESEESFQAYSMKDLQRIRGHSKSSSTTNNLIHETFEQFERFLLTHEVNLTDDALVELLIIDTSLLQIPFHAHNQILLRNISKTESNFLAQILKFIEKFLLKKYQDMKFLLTVDMNGFFDNIELLLHNLTVSNLFNDEMESFFRNIVDVMERFAENKWSCAARLKNIHESYLKNRDAFKQNDVSFEDF